MTFRGKSQKTDTEGGIAEKEGLGQFADLRGLGKKEGGRGGGGLIPQCTLCMHLSHSKLSHNTDYAALVLDLLKDLWEESYLLQLGARPSNFTRKGLWHECLLQNCTELIF